MKMRLKRTIVYLSMLCSILAVVTSCRNDGDDEELGGGATGQPPIITFDNGTGAYTVKITRKITITPVVTGATAPVVYSWKDDNGKIVSTEPSYTFSSPAVGESYLKFRVDAKNGSAEEELRIDVVEKMIPSVSLIPTYYTYVGKNITIEPSVDFTEDAIYKWTLNGEEVGTEKNYTFKPTEEGIFTFSLTVENKEDGGSGKVAKTDVIVSAKPELSITFADTQMPIKVLQGRAVCVAPNILNAPENITYEWERNGMLQPEQTSSTFTFTPQYVDDTYEIKVTGIVDGDKEHGVSAIQTYKCIASDEVKNYRAPTAQSTNWLVTVYEFMPAPGQFIRNFPGSNMKDACDYVKGCLNTENNKSRYVSLGAWGGYIIVSLDHSIYNKPESSPGKDGYDFSIVGNPFKGSSEPGIVYVMQDENGDGLPNDTWYELRGSETGKPETIQNYAVTYFRPPAANMPLQWMDNRGNAGTIDLNPQFPKWVKSEQYTLYGTRLKANSRLADMWYNDAYQWGYADNWGEDILTEGDNHDADAVGNAFKIENAMYPNGILLKDRGAELRYIDFIKVHTGVQSKAGILGEVSTEVYNFVDLDMEKAPSTLQ